MPLLDCFVGQDELPSFAERNISIIRGDATQFGITFRDPETLEPIDFTGWTFEAEARSTWGGTLWTTATVTHNGAGGRVLVTFPAAETALLTPDAVGVWDLQGTDTGNLPHTVVRGTATVLGDSTA